MMTRPTRPIRATDGRISHPIRGFDSLHPLHLSTRKYAGFPSERNAWPPQQGRDRGYRFTEYSRIYSEAQP
jgi:hypothetical protein